MECAFIDLSARSALQEVMAFQPYAVISVAPIFAVSGLLRSITVARGVRVVACSSMSAVTKSNSPIPSDGKVARLLIAGERELASASGRLRPVVIRPTMIYGDTATENVASLQRFARRWGVLPCPAGFTGWRQPLHAADLAEALVAAVVTEAAGGTFELGGGSRLRFSDLIRTVAETEGARIQLVPTWGSSWIARAFGAARLPWAGALYRLGQDQVADNTRAAAELGICPRRFLPLREEA
jgi:nucleoside-diphosphate-sugar epimerase